MALSTDARTRLGIATTDFSVGGEIANAIDVGVAAAHSPVTFGPVGSTPSAAAASVAAQIVTLQPVSGTYAGLMSAADYTRLANTSGTNTGNQDLSGLAPLAGATFTGPVRGTTHALTSASNSIAVDLGLGNYFTHITTESTTLAAPTNVAIGQTGWIRFTNAASTTLAFNVFWRFSNGILPSLTLSAGAIDLLSYTVIDATYALCALAPDIK